MRKSLQIVTSLTLFVFMCASFAVPVEAKILPQAKKRAKVSATQARGCGKNVTFGKRLRADKQAVIISFCNLTKVKNVSYTLVYKTNGVEQGVAGSFNSSRGNSASRELVFGTASSGVYTYHTNITNAHIDLSIEFPSGKTVERSYSITI